MYGLESPRRKKRSGMLEGYPFTLRERPIQVFLRTGDVFIRRVDECLLFIVVFIVMMEVVVIILHKSFSSLRQLCIYAILVVSK